MAGRVLLYVAVGIGAVGLVLASATARMSGALLIVAGVLLASAAGAGVTSTYASPEMPRQTVRLGSIALVFIGCIFFAIGVGELTA